ncbi:MAG: sensor domain-containing diguanylate cyclase [bacterium]|nr:sensor domain-containing diguanylate cyclase [bacterium]
MAKTNVKIRKEAHFVSVEITSKDKPEISEVTKRKWQALMNLASDLFEVPAGLIMKITPTDMEVFISSQNPGNPYAPKAKDRLGHGLYCESAIGYDQRLHVPNALNDATWATNPDIHLHMISYVGYPLKWADNQVFGTICILDQKERNYDEKQFQLIEMFQDLIETDLQLIEANHQLQILANVDPLTKLANRHKMIDFVREQIENYRLQNSFFSLAIIDLDSFKAVNDQYGHRVGDKVLIMFSSFIQKKLDHPIFISRYGGDEFVVVFPNVTLQEADMKLSQLQTDLLTDSYLQRYQLQFSYGIDQVKNGDVDELRMIDRADKIMMVNKKKKNSNHTTSS